MKIDDIAKLANVSKSAVSLALNGKAGVSAQTRKRILEIARKNGYTTRPLVKIKKQENLNTKILRFVACTNLGIVSEQYQSLSFFMELINSIDQSISEKGYSLVISSIKTDNLEEEISQLEQEQQSVGVLLLGTNLSAEQVKMVKRFQPNLVVLDTCFETLDVNFVVMNNIYGASQAAEYLINSGHQRIGYVESNSRMYNFDMRKKGFMQSLTDNELAIDKNHFFSISPLIISSQEPFKQHVEASRNNLPTALFCECDYMAISVIKSLSELGISVPGTISVIGFDDIFEAQVVSPELTTIGVPKASLAKIAVDKLISQIENFDEIKIKTFVDTELIKRNSCKNLQGEVLGITV